MQQRAAIHPILIGMVFSGVSLSGWCHDAPVVKIGHVAPLSGPLAHIGKAVENGARMAVEELNARNLDIGARKVKFELLGLDDAADPRQAAEAARRLCSLKVHGVVGPLNSGAALAASPIYNDCGVPNIVPSAISPGVTSRGFKTTFRLAGSDSTVGVPLARFAAERMSIKRVVVFHDRTAYGMATAEGFKRGARGSGIEVVDEVAIDDKATDFSSLFGAVRKSRPDAVFFGGLDVQAGPLLRQMTAAGLGDLPMLGPDGICTEQLAKVAGTSGVKDVTCARAVTPVELTIAGRQWKARYSASFGPTLADVPAAAAAYDAVMVFADAMQRAKSADPRDYLPSLRNTQYRGVTGTVRFDDRGELRNPPVTFYRFDEKGTRFALREANPPFPPPPPPQPPPPPPPPPDLSIAELPEPGIFWNSWVQEKERPVDKLDVGADYDLAVDLSRYRYLPRQGAPAGTVLARAVRHAMDAGEKEIRLVIRPALAGSALVRPAGSPADYRITVDLTKLARPDAATREADRRTWARFNAKVLTLAEISQQFRAAGLLIPVRAAENGCAQVALSVWDRTGMRPLDHLVHTIPVGDRDACGAAAGGALQAGSSTLLESLPHAAAAPADAALHVFDLPAGTLHKGIALFVDGTPLKTGGAPVLHAWRLESDIGRYLSDPSQLLALLIEARRSGSYAAVAAELKKKLFSTDPARQGEAEAALQALKRIAKESTEDAVVLMRVASADGKLVYLPLSLLAASSASPILERGISVVHPSPEPSRPAPGCVAPWTFAIPSTLERLGTVALHEEDAVFIGQRRRENMARLRQYLAEGAGGPTARRAEGLVLLAHHDKGNLWFDKNTDRVVIEDLRRSFSPGSVAVLSACSAANPEGDNEQWVRKISAQGVDAILASPFPVPMEYGVALARELVGVVRTASAAGETPSVATLFARASSRAAAQLKKSGIQAADVRLEFVLIGDHGIRMCKGPL